MEKNSILNPSIAHLTITNRKEKTIPREKTDFQKPVVEITFLNIISIFYFDDVYHDLSLF